MKSFALSFGDACRGVVALGLIGLGVGVVAPLSWTTAAVMMVAAVLLVTSGPSAPVVRGGR